MKREFSNNALVVVAVQNDEGTKSCPCSGFVEAFKVVRGEAWYLVWLDVDRDGEPEWFPAKDVRGMIL